LKKGRRNGGDQWNGLEPLHKGRLEYGWVSPEGGGMNAVTSESVTGQQVDEADHTRLKKKKSRKKSVGGQLRRK